MTLRSLWRWLTDYEPLKLCVVRRYPDANDNYIGELYAQDKHGEYWHLGMSLDSLPLSAKTETGYVLDTGHVFTDPMPTNMLRVGHQEPAHNDTVRRMLAETPRRNITISIQNRFVEHILGPKPVKKTT